jgi:hypothetical protein
MCGGGELGGSNNKSNDDKKGSGNSAGENLANLFTPNDGFSYVDGRLTADRDRDTYSGVSSNPNEQRKNIMVRDRDGGSFFVPKNETKKYNDRLVTSAVIGGLTGGLGGVALGIGGNAVRNKLFPRDYESDRTPSIADMPRRPNTGGLSTVSDRFGNPLGGVVNPALADNPQMQNIRSILGNANANAAANRSANVAANRNTPTGIASVSNNVSGLNTNVGGYTDPNTYVEGVDYGTTNAGGFKGMFQPGGIFAGPQFETAEERSKYMLEQKNRAIENSRTLADGSDNNDRPEQTVVDPVVEDVPLTRTQIAEQGSFQAIPNPDYDPSDPMSPRFLLNPSYEQLVEYQQSQVAGMAMGGYPGQNMMLSANEAFKMRQPMYSEPLQQYGNYLEGEYGDSGFEQKKDNFLEEVNMKEQQTFGQGGLGNLMMAQPRPDPRGPMNFAELQTNPMQASPFPQNLTRGFAEGGELEVAPQEGGNEKTDIVDAVMAVKGEMSKEEASVALGKFLATYGEEALKNLVEAVQSGELDDTIERFANGEAGEVNGPGDGSGVDDKVPASLEGQQDVLLADGEFVLRKKTADALEKKYGGGFLDTINEAENDAPRVIRELAARTA